MMKKVILPFDGGKFSEGAFAFAISLNDIHPILLTGIFLSQLDFSKFFLFPPSDSQGIATEKDTEEKNIQRNIEQFSSLCFQNNIQFKIHANLEEFAIPELTKETRFADLLIIGSEIFFKHISKEDSTLFLEDTLQHTECPVLVVPEKYYLPSQNILAYDGSASSVFAIKQFAYLFPHLCSNKTILVYAGEQNEDIPAQVNIEELATSHFSNLAITLLSTKRKKNLNEWIMDRENPILVSGSFGRSGFSYLFIKSFVINIIDAHKTPVFIAHQ
jgi:nucleotide-binding universal stress UspA family protein